MDNFRIDTAVVFSGNRVYILMFDLDKPESNTATQPIGGTQAQVNI